MAHMVWPVEAIGGISTMHLSQLLGSGLAYGGVAQGVREHTLCVVGHICSLVLAEKVVADVSRATSAAMTTRVVASGCSATSA